VKSGLVVLGFEVRPKKEGMRKKKERGPWE
jgi:hypothetical protein